MKWPKSISGPTVKQFLPFIFLFLLAIAGFAFLAYTRPSIFDRFLPDLNPVLVLVVGGILGGVSLLYLVRMGWPAFVSKMKLATQGKYLLLLLAFTALSIFIDLIAGFPAGMNVLFPESLVFYPSMAFLVEMLFHLLPLSVFLLIFKDIFKDNSPDRLLWICLILTAFLEPTYQIAYAEAPLWALFLIWVNLFLFNLTQLKIFKNHGFFSMYLFRLVYYGFWHILWGQLRLEILF